MRYYFDAMNENDVREIVAHPDPQLPPKLQTAQALTEFLLHKGMGAVCRFRQCFHPSIIVGRLLFSKDKHLPVFHVRDLFVLPYHRRKKIATNFVHRLSWLAHGNRCVSQIEIPETNLPAQLFFRACEWLCSQIRDEAYTFQFPRPSTLSKSVKASEQKSQSESRP